MVNSQGRENMFTALYYIYWRKKLHINRPMQFKPRFFKFNSGNNQKSFLGKRHLCVGTEYLPQQDKDD